MENEKELPPVPVFNLGQIIALREKLIDKVFYPLMGVDIEGVALYQVADKVSTVLKLGSSSHAAVLDSIRHLAGKMMDPALAKETSWRLAGNSGKLRDEIPVIPWSCQTDREWVPVQILSSRYHIRKKVGQAWGDSGRMFRFRFLSGAPCPGLMVKFWSNKMSDFVGRKMGFTEPRLGMSKKDGAEMTSMRLVVLLEPHLCRRGPGFNQFICPDSMVSYNKALIRKRRRIGFACPFLYDHECFQCQHGIKTCDVATHSSEYVRKQCIGCGQESWFDTDPSWVNDMCLKCQPFIDSGIPLNKVNK